MARPKHNEQHRIVFYCRVFVVLLLGFIASLKLYIIDVPTQITVFTGYRRQPSPMTDCHEFMARGHLEDNNWRPDGCHMIHYNNKSVAQCLKRSQLVTKRRNYFLFIGDSRMREQFLLFVDAAASEQFVIPDTKASINYTDELFDAEFRWNAHLDSFPELEDLLTSRRPTFVVMCFGLWFVRDGSSDFQNGFKLFTERLEQLKMVIKKLISVTRVIFMLNGPVMEYRQYSDVCAGSYFEGFMTRVGVGNSSHCGHSWLHNKWITQYNDATVRMLSNISSSSTFIWSAASSMSQHFAFDTLDSIHLVPMSLDVPPSPALHLRAQMLLNFHCNQFMESDSPTTDGEQACCRSAM